RSGLRSAPTANFRAKLSLRRREVGLRSGAQATLCRTQGRSRRAQAPFCREIGARAEAQGKVAVAQASGGERKVMLRSRMPSDRVSEGMSAVAQGRSRSAQASRAQQRPYDRTRDTFETDFHTSRRLAILFEEPDASRFQVETVVRSLC